MRAMLAAIQRYLDDRITVSDLEYHALRSDTRAARNIRYAIRHQNSRWTLRECCRLELKS